MIFFRKPVPTFRDHALGAVGPPAVPQQAGARRNEFLSVSDKKLAVLGNHLNLTTGPLLASGHRLRNRASSRQLRCKFGSKSCFRLHAFKPAPVSLLEGFEKLPLYVDKLFHALLPHHRKLREKQIWRQLPRPIDVRFLLGHDAVSIRSPSTQLDTLFLPCGGGRQVKRPETRQQQFMEPAN